MIHLVVVQYKMAKKKTKNKTESAWRTSEEYKQTTFPEGELSQLRLRKSQERPIFQRISKGPLTQDKRLLND